MCPFPALFAPLEVFYCTRFGLKHHMIVQLAYLHWAGLTNLFLFAHLGTLKGPQCGIFWPNFVLFGSWNRFLSPKNITRGPKVRKFGPKYQEKRHLGGYYIRHYRPYILVFPELLLSQNGFICSTNAILGILGGPNGIKSESSWSTKAVGYLVYLTFEIKSYAVWDFQTTDNAVKGHSRPLPTWAPQCHLSDPK